MMENRPSCRRWVTTNQDEFQNPSSVRVNRNIDSAEFARYERCMERQARCEEQLRATAKETLCKAEQEMNREPVLYPTDSHIDEGVKCKKPWCRCLATGDPNCYEEHRVEKATDDLCCCQKLYNQTEPTPESNRQRAFASSYFIDFRDPDYNYIASKVINKQKLDETFQAYKAKADAEVLKKEPQIAPSASVVADNRIDPNCLGLYDDLPPEIRSSSWKPDESWRNETPECIKNLVKKYIYTSTYREMNKDGAAGPINILPIPKTCLESPPGDPMKRKPEMAPCTMYDLSDVFTKWDRPQIRHHAGRCDTMYNRPCLDYDPYFKDHHLHRTKFAHCTEFHDRVSLENIRLAKEDRLRIPYDLMIPDYAGYHMLEVPPICKIKKPIDYNAPDTDVTTYKLDFVQFPKKVYEVGVSGDSFKPLNFVKLGMTGQPISGLSRVALPPVSRLSCYAECGKKVD